MNNSSEIKEIIYHLNTLSLNSNNESLLSLSTKSLTEKLYLLSQIFQYLDVSLFISLHDLQTQSLEVLASRYLDTLNLLQYPIPSGFDEFFSSGDNSIFYSILFYLLHNSTHLKQRAFTSRYLRTIDIPSE